MQAGNCRITKELIILTKEHGGLGISILKKFWSSLKLGWIKRTYHSQSFWLRLLTEKNNFKMPPSFWTKKQREEAFSGEQNPFWKQTLSSWKKLLKNTESGIQDRTTGTKYREINELLDTA